MAQQYVTIISNGKGMMSIHRSFKQACADYGWEYDLFKQRIPKEHDGYSLTKHPIGTTISCLLLLEFVIRKGVKTSCTKSDGFYYIDIETANKSYTIRFEYEEKHSPLHEIETDRGTEIMESAYTYDELTSVGHITDNDKEAFIKFDRYTEKHLLNLISID